MITPHARTLFFLPLLLLAASQSACHEEKPGAEANRAESQRRESALPLLDSSRYANLGENELVYALAPVWQGDTLQFAVEMMFAGDSSGSTTLVLPNRYGGQWHLDGIQNLQTLSPATAWRDTDQSHRKQLVHPPRQTVHVKYRVAQTRHGKIRLGNHYQTVLREKHFHFLGETFFALPDWDYYKSVRVKLHWHDLPADWTLANSFGIGQTSQEIELTLWKFWHSIFAGGDFRIYERQIEEQPIYVAIRGEYDFTDDEFNEMVLKIIKAERDFWSDYVFPYYLVTATPISGNGDQAGTGRTNAFAMFLSGDRELDYRLKRLLAHEAFHTWNGGKIGRKEPEVLVYWFSEGFSDYYGRLLLLRAGLLTPEDYVREYNKVLKRYYSSPARHARNERLLDEFWGNDINQLPYWRGDIVAHNLSAAIRAATVDSASLDDAMKKVLAAAVERGVVISDSSLRAVFRSYLDDDRVAKIMKAIDGDEFLQADPLALSPCATLKLSKRRKYFLFGEQLEIPQYQLISETNANCFDNSR